MPEVYRSISFSADRYDADAHTYRVDTTEREGSAEHTSVFPVKRALLVTL